MPTSFSRAEYANLYHHGREGPAPAAMTTFQKWLTGCIVAALLLLSWLGRYELHPVSFNRVPAAYVLDRWTGQVDEVVTDGRRAVKPEPALLTDDQFLNAKPAGAPASRPP